MRDPLIALGCQDPVERVSEAKKRDAHRQSVAQLFNVWRKHHRDEPVAASKIHEEVRECVDPQRRGRQYVASVLEKHVGIRIAGFVLTRQETAGRWGAATYALIPTDRAEEHRDHRGHRGASGASKGLCPLCPLCRRARRKKNGCTSYERGRGFKGCSSCRGPY